MTTDAGDAAGLDTGQAGRVKASLSRLSPVFLGSCLAQCCATTKHLGLLKAYRPISKQSSVAWTNQRRDIGLGCPDPGDGPAWLSGLKVPHWWLICPLDRQTPAPLSLSRQLYSKEIFVTKYFPNYGDRQVESVYLNSHALTFLSLSLFHVSFSEKIFLVFEEITYGIKCWLNCECKSWLLG